MGVFTDLSQDGKISDLETRVKRLEKKLRGDNAMSRIIKDLIGQDCTVSVDYEELKCRMIDADEDWVRILVYGKKKNDETRIVRIEDIKSISII